MGYPDGLLKNRSVIKHGVYAVVAPEGRVINSIPGFDGCALTIVASPKMGASFVQYVGTVQPDGGTTKPFASEEMIESFVYFMDGEGSLKVSVGDEEQTLTQGGYAFAPADKALSFQNIGDKPLRVLLYKQRYIPLEGQSARTVFGNANDIEEVFYDDMENVFIRDLLPIEMGFDMNMHILSFDPSGSHPFVETHVQEHGAYLTEGEGIYLLGEDWVQVQAEDFIWFGPFTQQAVYATGRGRLTYIYSKDCNRDVDI
ncbi:MAG: (S)-ureidoglycine aminohydrolase [Oceanospirillales bacterium LUC14_002_19_P2]|nr:MAG: (S)-ureidoglycine aminohydrolase [Oceanospirillales bacterium LUC14_002_19_P2]